MPIARPRLIVFLVAAALGVWFARTGAQRTDVFVGSRDHPAIAYSTGAVDNVVAALDRRLGDRPLAFEPGAGYLRAVLAALDVPIESQLLVFSHTSAQAKRIDMKNPRALFFNERVAVGWVRGAESLELAAFDARQGTIFYTLEQQADRRPRFRRDDTCLACHLTWETLGVPGPMVITTFPMPDDKHAYAQGFVTDHRSPYAQRWGGWYVTGQAPASHMGNIPTIFPKGAPDPARGPPAQLRSVVGRFDPSGYLSAHSDVAALMVLEHQARMTNLITRVGWEARVAAAGPAGAPGPAATAARGEPVDRVRQAVNDLVDYLLFIDEEPLPQPVRGSSGFSASFSAKGPRDSANRSLYELDLVRRLLKHRCSYMIYTPAFDGMPPAARAAVYERLYAVLAGRVQEPRYDRVPLHERRAIVDILRSTKTDLPEYFRPL